ncbi:MAG: tetratricopeptide repeat protein [Bacteroidales bacterium]|jgi:tetratricopeptide (TPR) repeat protein|nr:tetratricopeptide repeat protein [Bacteroidales bacterium]
MKITSENALVVFGTIFAIMIVFAVIATLFKTLFAAANKNKETSEVKDVAGSTQSIDTDNMSNPFSFVITKAKETMEKDAEQHLNQGDRENDPDRKIAAYEMAIKLQPDLIEAYINMGLTYDNMKNDFVRALQCYEKALSIKPNSNDAHFNMGCTYARMKEFDKAIACYENAIKYNPHDFEAYWYMGCCYRDKGDEENQIKWVKTAAELGDEKAQSWLLDKGFIKVSVKKPENDPRKFERELILSQLKAAEERAKLCGHDWVMSHQDGRLYCSKCGEDGGSPWDC